MVTWLSSAGCGNLLRNSQIFGRYNWTHRNMQIQGSGLEILKFPLYARYFKQRCTKPSGGQCQHVVKTLYSWRWYFFHCSIYHLVPKIFTQPTCHPVCHFTDPRPSSGVSSDEKKWERRDCVHVSLRVHYCGRLKRWNTHTADCDAASAKLCMRLPLLFPMPQDVEQQVFHCKPYLTCGACGV